jgi:hypothetical protein
MDERYAIEAAAAGRALLRLVPASGPLDTPCWIWPGSLNVRTGYGQIHVGGKVLRVYRLLYRVLVADPTPGLELHHRCEDRACANPHHLEEIARGPHIRISNSPAGINARKEECVNRHPLSGANLGNLASGRRRCLTCHRERQARYDAAKRGALVA